jgi:hypothetical protein
LRRIVRRGAKERAVKSRFLSPGEKRDVEAAALSVLRPQNPGCSVKISVEDWTDDRGVPVWHATIEPAAEKKSV